MWFIAKPFRSPGALNVEIDGMWMGTSNTRITTIVDNNGQVLHGIPSRHPLSTKTRDVRQVPKKTETLSSTGGEPCPRQGSRFHLILRPSNTLKVCEETVGNHVIEGSRCGHFLETLGCRFFGTSPRAETLQKGGSRFFGVLFGLVGFAGPVAWELIHTPQISAFTIGKFHWNGQPQMLTGISEPVKRPNSQQTHPLLWITWFEFNPHVPGLHLSSLFSLPAPELWSPDPQ